MKTFTLYTILLLIPCLTSGQWTQNNAFIDGDVEFGNLGSENSINIDAKGNTIIVGTRYSSITNQNFYGYAQVYDLVGDEFIQRGKTFYGNLSLDATGAANDISADGMTIAIGSSEALNTLGYRSGIVNVYDWDGEVWNLRGSSIEGDGTTNPPQLFDKFGSALDLSSDGNSIVIGGPGYTPEGQILDQAGHARVYQWNGQNWLQMGEDIKGENILGNFGYAVSINDSGTIVAIGGNAPQADQNSEGVVHIYEWLDQNWVLKGDPFKGSLEGSEYGAAVKLSSDGNTVAIGAPNHNEGAGLAQVFNWDGSTWNQKGPTFFGAELSQTGVGVDLSADGNIFAVGRPLNEGLLKGVVNVYHWENDDWSHVNNVIEPENIGYNEFGKSVSLNIDGTVVAIGAPRHDSDQFNTGRIFLYENGLSLSTKNNDNKDFQIFPNPTSDLLNIRSSFKFEKIIIYDMLGQEVMSTNVKSLNYFNIDIRHLSKGSYIISINSETISQNTNIIKL